MKACQDRKFLTRRDLLAQDSGIESGISPAHLLMQPRAKLTSAGFLFPYEKKAEPLEMTLPFSN